TKLRPGFRLPRPPPRLGPAVAALLRPAAPLLGRLGAPRLRALLPAAFLAPPGAGPALARLLASARLLVAAAPAPSP
ncbi:mammalian cell entry protein, partial [Mycobacterium tuberculosis]